MLCHRARGRNPVLKELMKRKLDRGYLSGWEGCLPPLVNLPDCPRKKNKRG